MMTGADSRTTRATGTAGRLVSATVIVAALMGAQPPAASGQRVPSLGGAELRVGLAVPEQAELAPGVFGQVDLGYLWTPPLRLLVGLSRYQANIDREPGGDEGSFTATGLWVGSRYDFRPWRTVAPYLRGGFTLHLVDADAFDIDVGSLLDGTYVGIAGGIGAAYRLDAAGRLAATAELRRTFINNVGNTAFELGIRLQRLGWDAYVRDAPRMATGARARTPRDGPPPAPTPAAPVAPTPAAPAPVDTMAERTLAELERALVEAERALQAAREAPQPGLPAAVDPVPSPRREADDAMLRQGLARAVAGMRNLSNVRETQHDFLLTLEGSVFASGSPSLTRPARDEIRVLATILAGYPGHIITVEGHTDAAGDARANQALSEARAAAVRAALIAEGVDPLWVAVRGFGAQRPVASNQTAAGRTANRRAEIRVAREACPVPPRSAPDGSLTCP